MTVFTRNEGGTGIGTGSYGSGALRLCITDRGSGTATENGIAFVGTRALNGDAKGKARIACGVLIASNRGRAGIGTGTGNFNALLLGIAFHMWPGVAIINERIALIRASTGDGDTSCKIRRTFIVRCPDAVAIRGAFIISSAIHGDAGVALADVVLLAIVVGDAFVGEVSLDDDTLELGVTFEMFVGIETVFAAETLVGRPFAGDGDTDVLCIADEVFAGVTFVALLAFIISCSSDDGAEVIHAGEVFIGLKTVGVCCAFVVSSAIDGDTGVALADVVLLAVVIGDAFVIGVSGNDDTGSGGGAFEVFVGIDAVFAAETVVGSFAGDGDTDVLGVTDEVFTLGVAFVALLAFIISCSSDDGAEVIHAGEVLIGLKTVGIGGAGIVTGSIDGDTGVALACVVH